MELCLDLMGTAYALTSIVLVLISWNEKQQGI